MGELFEDLHKDPAFNNIQNKIHEASKQLKSANPKHDFPNIIFFINHHPLRGVQDLKWVMTGEVSSKAPDVLNMRFLKRLSEDGDLSVIDFIIWKDSFKDKIFYSIRSESPFENILKANISSKWFEILEIPL